MKYTIKANAYNRYESVSVEPRRFIVPDNTRSKQKLYELLNLQIYDTRVNIYLRSDIDIQKELFELKKNAANAKKILDDLRFTAQQSQTAGSKWKPTPLAKPINQDAITKAEKEFSATESAFASAHEKAYPTLKAQAYELFCSYMLKFADAIDKLSNSEGNLKSLIRKADIFCSEWNAYLNEDIDAFSFLKKEEKDKKLAARKTKLLSLKSSSSELSLISEEIENLIQEGQFHKDNIIRILEYDIVDLWSYLGKFPEISLFLSERSQRLKSSWSVYDECVSYTIHYPNSTVIEIPSFREFSKIKETAKGLIKKFNTFDEKIPRRNMKIVNEFIEGNHLKRMNEEVNDHLIEFVPSVSINFSSSEKSDEGMDSSTSNTSSKWTECTKKKKQQAGREKQKLN